MDLEKEDPYCNPDFTLEYEDFSEEVIMKNMHKRNLSTIWFAVFLIILILATGKYVADGERYVFSTPWQDSPIELNANIISQDIIISDGERWNKKSFAVYLSLGAVDQNFKKEGVLAAELWQDGNLIDRKEIPSAWLKDGYFELKWLDFSQLSSGSASVILYGENINFPVYTGLAGNVYNLPNCYVNGSDSGNTLVQQYHYNYNNFAHKLGVALFIIFVLSSALSIFIFAREKTVALKSSIALIINLIISYMVLAYIYDSSLYLEPTWAEAVTNFMSTSKFEGLSDTILKSDSGYLPLFQRCITIFYIDVLRLSPCSALYAMQITAYFISGVILSFFMWKEFEAVLPAKLRYIICLLVMCLTIQKETGAFINFITYGSLVIFLYFLVDSEKWSKWKYLLICAFCFMACLSKGVYVTMLPFMVVCLILFYRNFNKRDFIFCTTVAVGALLQLIYYLTNGSDWVDRFNTSAKEHYRLKLIAEIFIDTPNKLLAVFTDKIWILNGLVYFIVVAFWIAFAYFFVKEVAIKWIKKQNISKNIQIVFMMLIYVMAQSLFLRITVYGVSDSDIFTDAFWSFLNYGIDNRYQVLIFSAVVVLGIMLTKLVVSLNSPKYILIYMACIITIVTINSSRLQIRGLGNDDYSTNNVTADLTTEVMLMKQIATMDSIVVPIQPTNWVYNRNSNVYCFGSNIYGWGLTSNIGNNEVYKGLVDLSDSGNLNPDARIYQIFVRKNCLIGSNNYKVNLYDQNGNLIISQVQDNEKNQKSTSFTFKNPIQNISTIQIVDEEENQVYIENALYVVTNQADQLYIP